MPLGIPSYTPPGVYTIIATDSPYTTSASIAFTVTGSFTLGSTSGYVGDTVTVTGSGFISSQVVSFYWDTSTTAFSTLTATTGGTLSGTIVIPAAIRGSHNISTSVSSMSAQTFTVNSKIGLNPSTGGVGDTVYVTGSGFAASSAITLSVDGSALATYTSPVTITTGTTGGFTASFTMPSAIKGSHTIQASDGVGSANTAFIIASKISLIPASGGVGDTVVVSGSGFSANQAISFKIDGVALTVTPTTVTTDAQGVFSGVSFTIPSLSGGTHAIVAADIDLNSGTTTLTLTPKITATPTTGGTVGSQITLTGSGFIPNATVSISWDNVALNPAVSTTASAAGTISVTFNVPASAYGKHSIKAVDTSANSASVDFKTLAKVTINPATGGYQDSITITYAGFTANSTITSTQMVMSGVGYNLATLPTTIQTDANGSATATFNVLGVYSGNWTIQATDSSSVQASATLAVVAKLTLNVTTGGAGDTITVIGSGFNVGRGITMTYNGVALTTTPSSITSDTNGSFSCQFSLPSTAAGTMVLKATDGAATATVNFNAVAKATVSKTTTQSSPGNVGMSMTVSGSGFKINSPITVTFESAPVTVATTTSDATGSFTATFKVPAAEAGNHTIKASDGTTTQSFAFFMDSTAPGSATLLTPLTATKAKQPVAFTWGDVADPSGVTYTLQISQDANFATLILEKTGIATATYKMTDLEKLARAGSKTPYYWRVKAIDLAGNAGEWSTASTFTIGFIWPSWMIHIWYSLGIVAALILGLWLGRRMAYQSY